jgi:hypothetical protein
MPHRKEAQRDANNRVPTLAAGLPEGLLPPHAVQSTEGDQHVDARVLIGDGVAVAQLGPLDTQLDSLGVDALGGGALLVDLLLDRTFAVELMAGASADAGGQGGNAALPGAAPAPSSVLHSPFSSSPPLRVSPSPSRPFPFGITADIPTNLRYPAMVVA